RRLHRRPWPVRAGVGPRGRAAASTAGLFTVTVSSHGRETFHSTPYLDSSVSYAAASSFGSWRSSQRAEAARSAWHARISRSPSIGRFASGVNTARFAATSAISADAGVPSSRASEAARQTSANECSRRAVSDATERIEGGSGSGAASRQQKVFPPSSCHSVASGEKTGTSSRMLERAAQTSSADIERRAMAMTAM
ncbi:hypothetical protein OY671_009361, partial [Metschnikowia pulcherrima]